MNTVRTEEKSLYSEKLKKQLAFLEDAQETALDFHSFGSIAEYSDKILELAKKIEELENASESPDRTVINDPAPETLGQFSTSDLLCELLNRNATHKHYDSLREITTVTVDYDGKLYDN